MNSNLFVFSTQNERPLRKGLVTVVMPNRNHGHYIGNALEALCTQTRRPDRLVVIDDQSEDDSRSIMLSIQKKYSFLEMQFNDVPKKTIGNLNEWLGLCDTEYIFFAAADDLVFPNFLERSLDVLEKYQQAAFSTTASGDIDENGALLPSPPTPPSSLNNFLTPTHALSLLEKFGSFGSGNTTIYRTEILRRVGGFQAELGAFADGYLIQSMALTQGCVYLPETLGVWRHNTTGNAASLSRSFDQLLSVTAAIRARMKGRDRAAFPDSYSDHFLRRWRYATARPFLLNQEFRSFSQLSGLSAFENRILKITSELFSPRYADYLLHSRLLPEDTLRVIRRKMKDRMT